MKKKKDKSSRYSTSEYSDAYPEESNPPPPEAQDREDQETILGLIAIDDDLQETEHPIRLTEKDPILIEKMLEFLYTGNYTAPSPTKTSEITQADGGDVPVMDRWPAEEPSYETLENTPETLVPGLQTNENPASIDEFHPEYASKEGDKGGLTEPIVDSLADCHPCYFHVRMYGEADYFMIDDLRSKAGMHFCASFMSSPERESFADTAEELHSIRANYQELRQLAIEMLVANLPNLRNGPTPVITSELMESIPNLTYDLFQATLDKYVREPSDMEGNPSYMESDYWSRSKRY
ncbi:hypothetical protein N7499_003118 [Penicillium canescens]|uniref:BTB domain-containing protein n=1 Tax=Penicillium canescens TaxID=5083 RepID=A0AAD6IBI2_PENCN|nr:uncharacterized protein N7446_011989 [Penicillium canescens]KAJ6019785.1 hypothetical protein N7522_000493 [Penicillium canescens]KAJ6039075.1 hypothetical protein N7460_007107 [Penicillium canescens]KAJ6047155.1 hypothetical protein N7446_011989 [Penicillium canescens]KAJ6059904.1 hypothetical protein N7444_003543 [Penicillium canescens]KAJ6093787.1 hypothetical protein N7499_003118 [Penicillium canescens]